MKLIFSSNCKDDFFERYNEYINDFIKSNLLDSWQYDSLHISIDCESYYESKTFAGLITMNSDYLNPKIRLFESGIDFEYKDLYSKKNYSFEQTKLFVLFHELSHMILALNDIPRYQWWFDDPNAKLSDGDIELNCNVMAERYLRKHGLVPTNRFPIHYLEVDTYLEVEMLNGGNVMSSDECIKFDKPSRELLEKYSTYVKGDSSFRANARLLQSMWRVEKFGTNVIGKDARNIRCLGNMLPNDFVFNQKHNFLNGNIFNAVLKAIKEKKKNGAMIQEPRIWTNLLSSQPLCFNLFAELSLDLALAKRVFSNLFEKLGLYDVRILSVDGIDFEYSPGRGNIKYTNDKTAFDVFIRYTSENKDIGFIGIEVKYSEDLKDKAAEHKERYQTISDESGIFRKDKLPDLMKKPLQQIWRDHLLALSLYKLNDDYKNGLFVYLFPNNNVECQNAINRYKDTFKETTVKFTGFCDVSLEKLTELIKSETSAQWIRDFEDRYLNFEKLKQI